MMDFLKGEILLINKPYGWSSFDVVKKIRNKIRHTLKIKDIKVGHAGTLDPLATGLLIICTGNCTKLIQKIQNEKKEYKATFLLGKTTPSFDLETEFNNIYPIEHISNEMIYETAKSFLGEQFQIPPIYSAKQIAGKRAYDLARQGIDIKLSPKKIIIEKFEITNINIPYIEATIVCSAGTYIRSIANDFGKKLNSGACLYALERTTCGNYNVKDALSIEQICYIIENIANLQKT